jgi:2-(3-amino-3-carboxypropyl)histidine synthase
MRSLDGDESKRAMRVHHIPVRRNVPVTVPAGWLATLPPALVFATTAQFLHQRESLVAQLQAAGKHVTLYQPRHTFHAGQILGCSTDRMPAGAPEGNEKAHDTQDTHVNAAFLYVGEGLFHPQALAYGNPNATIYTYDPVSQKTGIIDQDEITRRRKTREAGIKLFYHATAIGVLLSTKSGQKDEIAVKKLREQFPEKQFYVFLGNTLDLQGLEDFPFVQVWLNTACPRIGYDDIAKTEKPLINAEDVLTQHRF